MKLNLQAMAALSKDKKALAVISESDFSAAVRGFAEATGWKVMYASKTGGFGRDGKTWRANAVAGWPDLALFRESDRRMVFLELKTMKGKPTQAQLDWLQTLAICGGETDVVKPSDAAQVMETLS